MTGVRRWLALACLALLSLLAAPASAQISFADRVALTLVADPARALAIAEAEQRALGDSAAARRDGRRGAVQFVAAQAHFRLGDLAATRAIITQARAQMPSGAARRGQQANLDFLEGLVVRTEGNIPAALALYQRAQSGFIAAHNRRGQGQALQALGALYADVGDGDNALRYLNLARETYFDDDIYRLSLLNNVGVAYLKRDDYAQALDQYRSALIIADRLRLPQAAERLRVNIAAAHIWLGQYRDAQRVVAPLGPVARLSNPMHRQEIYRIDAVAALAAGRRGEARQLIEHALDGVNPETSDGANRSAHWSAYQIYRAIGDTRLAFIHLEALRRLDEADAQQVASNRTALIGAQFQFTAQNARIAQLRAEQLRRAVIFERERNRMQQIILVVSIIGAAIGLSLLGGLLVVANRARKRAEADGALLAITNVELQHALAAKTNFLSATSHEMRTPLNGILGMAQILLAGDTLDAGARAQVALIEDAGGNLRHLVDDLLDVAKIENGGFSSKRADTMIGPLLRAAIARLGGQARSAGLTLDQTIDLPDELIVTDGPRVAQMVTNLLGNAIKFTAAGGIVVSARREADAAGDMLVIAVSDTGVGIPPEWADRVFDLFSQVDNGRSRTYGGTGLGLAICRQIAQSLGGDVDHRPNPAGGTIFTIKVPYEVSVVSVVIDAPDVEVRPTAILLCDDPLRSALLGSMVGRSGFAARPVKSTGLNDALAALSARSDGAIVPLLCDAACAEIARAALIMLPADTGVRLIIVGGVDAAGDHAPSPAGDGTKGADLVPIVHIAFALNPVITALQQYLVSPAVNGMMHTASDITDDGHQGEPDRVRRRRA